MYIDSYMATNSKNCAKESTKTTCKPESIMLSILPIILSRISHNFYPLFLCHHLLAISVIFCKFLLHQ